MQRRLRTHVTVHDSNFASHTFGPDDEVPRWARKKITNPKAWASDEDEAATAASSEPPADTGVPPQNDGTQGSDAGDDGTPPDTGDAGDGGDEGTSAGAPERPAGNASRENWAAYARHLGVNVTGAMGRDDIRDAVAELDAAGDEGAGDE